MTDSWLHTFIIIFRIFFMPIKHLKARYQFSSNLLVPYYYLHNFLMIILKEGYKKMNNSILKINEYDSLAEILQEVSEKYPENLFIVENEASFSYSTFNNLVNYCCNFLKSIGVKEGDYVSLVLRNSIDFLILYFGCLRSGIIVNPFPFHVAADEILSKIEIVNPKLIFSHEKALQKLESSRRNVYNLDNINGKNFQNI